MLGGDYSAEARADVAEHFNVSPQTIGALLVNQAARSAPSLSLTWRGHSGGVAYAGCVGPGGAPKDNRNAAARGDFTAEAIGLQRGARSP